MDRPSITYVTGKLDKFVMLADGLAYWFKMKDQYLYRVTPSQVFFEEAEQITAEITVEEAVTSTWEEKYVNGILTGFTIVCLIAILGGVIWFSRRR